MHSFCLEKSLQTCYTLPGVSRRHGPEVLPQKRHEGDAAPLRRPRRKARGQERLRAAGSDLGQLRPQAAPLVVQHHLGLVVHGDGHPGRVLERSHRQHGGVVPPRARALAGMIAGNTSERSTKEAGRILQLSSTELSDRYTPIGQKLPWFRVGFG